MNSGFWVVVGMSIAYLACFAGMIFAWIHYNKRKKAARDKSQEEQKKS